MGSDLSRPSGPEAASDRAGEPRSLGPALGVLGVLAFLASYGESMLVPATSAIAAEFDVTPAISSAVTAAYLLAGALLVPVAGRLGDRYGLKRVLLVFALVFAAASVLGAFAPNFPSLVAIRAVQGCGLAMLPLSLALADELLPPERVPFGGGLLSALNGIGIAVGLLVGAVTVEHLFWQADFLILGPIVVVAVVFLWRSVPETKVRATERIDVTGTVLLAGSIGSLLVGVSIGADFGWDTPVFIGLLVAAAALGALFVLADRRAPAPLFRPASAGGSSLLKLQLAMFATGFLIFLTLETVLAYAHTPSSGAGLGISLTAAALVLVPAIFVMSALLPFAALRVRRVGPREPEIAGAVLMIAGSLSFFFLHDSPEELVVAATLTLGGASLLFTALVSSIDHYAGALREGAEMGVNSMARFVGESIAVTVTAVLLATYVDPITLLPTSQAFDILAITGTTLASLALLAVVWLPTVPLDAVKGSFGH